MVDARVDLPEPLGPMMAWVSPVRMVRLTPFRISLVPCSVSMLTCRSLISRVDMCLVLLCTVPGGGGAVSVWKLVRNSVVLAEVGCFGAVEDAGEVHVDLIAPDLDGEDGHGIIGRQLQRFAGAQVELGAVAPALDGTSL